MESSDGTDLAFTNPRIGISKSSDSDLDKIFERNYLPDKIVTKIHIIHILTKFTDYLPIKITKVINDCKIIVIKFKM